MKNEDKVLYVQYEYRKNVYCAVIETDEVIPFYDKIRNGINDGVQKIGTVIDAEKRDVGLDIQEDELFTISEFTLTMAISSNLHDLFCDKQDSNIIDGCKVNVTNVQPYIIVDGNRHYYATINQLPVKIMKLGRI